MTQKPYLNLGCGRVILPAPKPAHHALVPDGVHDYALWHNVDKVRSEGVDEAVDVFRYPFPWADNSYDGALLTHLVEHIPHEIRRVSQGKPFDFTPITTPDPREYALSRLPDGFFAFFSELHRVLTPNAAVHIVVPYAFSTGAMQDPTHHRYLVPNSFDYLVPDENAPFVKADAGSWAVETVMYGVTDFAKPYQHDSDLMSRMLQTQWNMASEFYIRLRVIK